MAEFARKASDGELELGMGFGLISKLCCTAGSPSTALSHPLFGGRVPLLR